MSSPDDEVHGVDPDEEADFDALFLRRGLLRGRRGDRAGATGVGEAGSTPAAATTPVAGALARTTGGGWGEGR